MLTHPQNAHTLTHPRGEHTLKNCTHTRMLTRSCTHGDIRSNTRTLKKCSHTRTTLTCSRNAHDDSTRTRHASASAISSRDAYRGRRHVLYISNTYFICPMRGGVYRTLSRSSDARTLAEYSHAQVTRRMLTSSRNAHTPATLTRNVHILN